MKVMLYTTIDYMEARSLVKLLKRQVKEIYKDLIAAQNDKLPDAVLELLNF